MIIDTDWDSLVWAATDRGRAARIAAAWNEHLPDPYLPGVQRSVELAVAAAAESLPGRLPTRGGDRGDAGEPREGGF